MVKQNYTLINQYSVRYTTRERTIWNILFWPFDTYYINPRMLDLIHDLVQIITSIYNTRLQNAVWFWSIDGYRERSIIGIIRPNLKNND